MCLFSSLSFLPSFLSLSLSLLPLFSLSSPFLSPSSSPSSHTDIQQVNSGAGGGEANSPTEERHLMEKMEEESEELQGKLEVKEEMEEDGGVKEKRERDAYVEESVKVVLDSDDRYTI